MTMLRRPLLLATAVVAALALAASPALASTRTANTPAQIDAYVAAGTYAKQVAATYTAATAYLTAALAKKPKVRKPAVVLDIDETSLSNLGCLKAAGYELIGLATCAVNKQGTAIRPAREFVKLAQRKGVKVVFITGRPGSLRAVTLANLKAQGFTGSFQLVTEPAGYKPKSVVPYKSGARRALAARGYRILENIGDQQSDLAGGYAVRTYKLPNPIYVTA